MMKVKAHKKSQFFLKRGNITKQKSPGFYVSISDCIFNIYIYYICDWGYSPESCNVTSKPFLKML